MDLHRRRSDFDIIIILCLKVHAVFQDSSIHCDDRHRAAFLAGIDLGGDLLHRGGNDRASFYGKGLLDRTVPLAYAGGGDCHRAGIDVVRMAQGILRSLDQRTGDPIAAQRHDRHDRLAGIPEGILIKDHVSIRQVDGLRIRRSPFDPGGIEFVDQFECVVRAELVLNECTFVIRVVIPVVKGVAFHGGCGKSGILRVSSRLHVDHIVRSLRQHAAHRVQRDVVPLCLPVHIDPDIALIAVILGKDTDVIPLRFILAQSQKAMAVNGGIRAQRAFYSPAVCRLRDLLDPGIDGNGDRHAAAVLHHQIVRFELGQMQGDKCQVFGSAVTLRHRVRIAVDRSGAGALDAVCVTGVLDHVDLASAQVLNDCRQRFGQLDFSANDGALAYGSHALLKDDLLNTLGMGFYSKGDPVIPRASLTDAFRHHAGLPRRETELFGTGGRNAQDVGRTEFRDRILHVHRDRDLMDRITEDRMHLRIGVFHDQLGISGSVKGQIPDVFHLTGDHAGPLKLAVIERHLPNLFYRFQERIVLKIPAEEGTLPNRLQRRRPGDGLDLAGSHIGPVHTVAVAGLPGVGTNRSDAFLKHQILDRFPQIILGNVHIIDSIPFIISEGPAASLYPCLSRGIAQSGDIAQICRIDHLIV